MPCPFAMTEVSANVSILKAMTLVPFELALNRAEGYPAGMDCREALAQGTGGGSISLRRRENRGCAGG